MEIFGVIGAVSAGSEILIELLKPLLNPVRDTVEAHLDIEFYMYLSALLGLLWAFVFREPLLAELEFLPIPNDAAAIMWLALLGLAFGKGANFVHELYSRVRPS